MFDRLRRLSRFLNPIRAIRRVLFALGNWRRRRFKKLDYVLLTLPRSMSAVTEPRSWVQRRIFGPSPLSLWELERRFDRIASDPRPRGVILHLRGFGMSLADLQTLRGLVVRLRQRGKRVVCFAQGYDNATYLVASAADEIIVQPGGEIATLGLFQQATFFKDALAALGMVVDVVAISPYKSALDSFARADFSPEARQQLDWLLDSRFAMLVNSIAEGRGVAPEAVREMIDGAPHQDEAAVAAGYVDAALNEEQLAAHLGVQHIVPWEQANKVLLKKWPKRADKVVALLPLSGLIVPGASGKPPVEPPVRLPLLGDERMGDLTVVRQVRNVMRDKSVGAVVLLIDSGGGSAAASEAMASSLVELAKDRPLVVYMNSVAASGGYYIATPARWIVAQPGTITGSIGVITAKVVTHPFWEKLHVNRLDLARGAHADLLSDSSAFTETQRGLVLQSVDRVYAQFTTRVAVSRAMSAEAVNAVGGGRVWTGEQARAHGLVDELGDLWAAVKKARELAALPEDAPVRLVSGKGQPLAPQLAEQANPAAALRYYQENLQMIASGLAQMLMPVVIE